MEEDEDQDDLLQLTDDYEDYESTSSENDENLDTSLNLPFKANKNILSKPHFYITLFTVNVSSILLTILLPLYLESTKKIGTAYIFMQFTTIFTILILICVILLAKIMKFSTVMFYKPPDIWFTLLKVSIIYMCSGLMILYSHTKVVCHIQDPIKCVLLVFALTYYFLFCKQFMKLQSIFATTTIIVGLFISVDYGLCNKFRCRGYELQADKDTQPWSLEEHLLWTLVYVGGLGLFAGFYTMLERHFIPEKLGTICYNKSSLLATVSCLVSSRDLNKKTYGHSISELMTSNKENLNAKLCSTLHVSLWLHIFGGIALTGIYWIDLLGQVSQKIELSGLLCHFTMPHIFDTTYLNCGNISLYGWLFLVAYIIYVVSSIHFLMMCESAVFVVAVAVAGLPITTFWWSLFRLDSLTPYFIVWAPQLSGELVCATLAIPIIVSGIVFFCKIHFQELHNTQDSSQQTTNLLRNI